MSFDLLSHIETCINRSLKQLTEADFRRHMESRRYDDQIQTNAYAQSDQGEIIGLCLRAISAEKLRDIPFEDFGAISYLFLIKAPLQDYSVLAGLSNLTSLDLSANQISDISVLAGLSNLTSLDLSANQISDISSLSGLTNLTSLSLLKNPISDISVLENLFNLTSLYLGSDDIIGSQRIQNISLLSQLTNLTFLYLRYANISDASFLSELTNLIFLELGDNRISDISFLEGLINLTFLGLSGNTPRRSEISKRTSQILDTSFLSGLTNLTFLSLDDNNISDISFLSGLSKLTSLDLRFNQISDISCLAGLSNLTALDLLSNQISDISFLAGLSNLTSLYLSSNQISDISFLAGLSNLTSLYLSSNQISDISFLAGLSNLTSLDLRSNQISDIPKWLAASTLDIRVDSEYASNCINLYDNSIETPPMEVVKQGNEAILNYYVQLESQGKDYLYEAKMLIVGEGEAGKTTMAYKIEAPNCPLPHIDDRTRGITIHRHTFQTSAKDSQRNRGEHRTFHLNIWDFGGQEIYHSTHRFFLSKRSLYVLVADNRKDDTDFNYWLNMIELFAGDSPLLIVLNEKDDLQRAVNFTDLRGRYPEILKDIISVNFKTQEEADPTKRDQRLSTIKKLIRSIEYHADNRPHIGEPVPARWVDVREAIETDDRNYIYREQFDELCHGQDITEPEDIATMLAYFHDLGIVLHFADQPLLRDRVILKPAWATNAVYRIFDNDVIKAKQGRFSRHDCAQLWSDPAYCSMQDVLIELMKRFRLVYEIEATTDTTSPGQLVAPQMLPKDTPTYAWDDAHPFQMQFRYDLFMPKGILWQFIVTLYRYIENHAWVWRNGVILRRGNTRAEVIENLQERRIYLRFSGPSIAEFRAIILDQLDAISTAYHHLDYSKMIPCQCATCDRAPTPHFFEYAVLKKRLESRVKDTIECQVSADDVPVRTLLQGFNIHPLVDGSNVGWVAAENPTTGKRSPENSVLGSLSLNPTYGGKGLSPIDRAKGRRQLFRLLKGLSTAQFDELVFVLELSPGTIPSGNAAGGDRTSALLQWAEGPTGIGLAELHDTLQLVLSPDPK